jgi:hypothetical protein
MGCSPLALAVGVDALHINAQKFARANSRQFAASYQTSDCPLVIV